MAKLALLTLAIAAGCSKGGMTRDQACDLLSVSSCAEIHRRESTCPEAQLEVWDTKKWRDTEGTSSPHQHCETLIANACCENAAGDKDCKQQTGVSREDVVLGPAKDSAAPQEQHDRIAFEEAAAFRIEFDKLSAPLGTRLVSCARQASERGACAPSDLDWLVACLGPR